MTTRVLLSLIDPRNFFIDPPKSSSATFNPLEIEIDPWGALVTTLGNSSLD